MNEEIQTIREYQQSSLINIQSEQSIINEYKQMSIAQESFLLAISPITFVSLPLFLPKSISEQYTHAIYLDNFSFYQMLTYAIFQYLFRNPTQQKNNIALKLKNMICSESFFKFNRYLKAIMLKTLNQMSELAKDQNYVYPLADCLMAGQKMLACCQCWKEIIYHFQKQNSSQQTQPSSIIEIFATYFCIEFKFYTKKGAQIIQEVVRAKDTEQIAFSLPIVLIYNNNEDVEQKPKRQQSFSEISSIYSTWSFYILVNYPSWKIEQLQEEINLPISNKLGLRMNRKANTLILEYPELFAIHEEPSRSSNINGDLENEQIIAKAKQVVKKGQLLLKEMKDFCQSDILKTKTLLFKTKSQKSIKHK